MKVEIKNIDTENLWEDFVARDENGSFLQSWNWGEFQKAMGEKIFRLGIFEGEELAGTCLLIKVHARRGDHFICPAGPLINWSDEKYFRNLVEYLKKLGKEEKVSFIRVRPPIEDTDTSRKLFRSFGFRPAPMHLHAERTWFLDIIPNEETLLAKMRKTTRYLIKKAMREGVEVFQSKKVKDIGYLYDLQRETVTRHGFVPFSKRHFETIFQIFSKDNEVSLFLAKYNKEIVSAAMVMFYKNEATYHYAATSSKYTKIPSSYLLVWQAILEAKRRKLTKFNFWGIAPPGKIYHRFTGVTLFKKGFGGYERVFLHAHDLPLTKWYLVNLVVEGLRKRVRRL